MPPVCSIIACIRDAVLRTKARETGVSSPFSLSYNALTVTPISSFRSR